MSSHIRQNASLESEEPTLAIRPFGRRYLYVQSAALPGGALLIYRLLDAGTHLLPVWNLVPNAAADTFCQTTTYPKARYLRTTFLGKFYSTPSPY